MADNASPGQKLRYYRLLNNLSQEELGRAVGCTLQGIVNYEKGFLDLYYENAVKFAEIFGVHPEIFMDEYTRFCKPGYGERIRIIRNLHGLSQQEFADQIVCSRATVSVWEAEIKDHHPERAAFEKIRQLAGAAGVNMALLLKNPDLYTDEYTVFIKNDCGRKIRQIRLSHGLIQEDFAHMIGCNTQTLVNWETSITRPKRYYFEKLKTAANAVGINLALLNKDPDYCHGDYQGFIKADCSSKIKSIRMACGCGLKEFGRLLGCTGEAVSQWERGICLPDLKYFKMIERIAQESGIHISQLNENPETIRDDYREFCCGEYGATIRKIRRLYNMSQRDFASLVHTTASTVSNWETMRFIPDRKHYHRLRDVAAEKGVDISDT